MMKGNDIQACKDGNDSDATREQLSGKRSMGKNAVPTLCENRLAKLADKCGITKPTRAKYRKMVDLDDDDNTDQRNVNTEEDDVFVEIPESQEFVEITETQKEQP